MAGWMPRQTARVCLGRVQLTPDGTTVTRALAPREVRPWRARIEAPDGRQHTQPVVTLALTSAQKEVAGSQQIAQPAGRATRLPPPCSIRICWALRPRVCDSKASQRSYIMILPQSSKPEIPLHRDILKDHDIVDRPQFPSNQLHPRMPASAGLMTAAPPAVRPL